MINDKRLKDVCFYGHQHIIESHFYHLEKWFLNMTFMRNFMLLYVDRLWQAHTRNHFYTSLSSTLRYLISYQLFFQHFQLLFMDASGEKLTISAIHPSSDIVSFSCIRLVKQFYSIYSLGFFFFFCCRFYNRWGGVTLLGVFQQAPYHLSLVS